MKHFIEFLRAILAGVAIAIGSLVFLGLGNSIAGMIGFSIGLYLILWFKLNLYTGKIGYATLSKAGDTSIIILGNILGTLILLPFAPIGTTVILLENKILSPWYLILIKSFICGILIYAGVDQYKKGKEYAPLLAVPTFIACGAEHCIADYCFWILSGCTIIAVQFLPFFLLVVIGNSLGSILFRLITKS